MIVTIDGPAGSGKSTAARKLAARLEVAYLDTGAMYRAIALAALQREYDFSDASRLAFIARSIKLELDCGPTHTRVRIDGHDVSEAVRSMAVSAVTSYVAKHPEVRAVLVEQQRRIGSRLGSLVSEGRDQGSVVFPQADAKFVLEAGLDKRAERRHRELLADGEDVSLASVRENLLARDQADSKQWAPLLAPGQAVVVDTTDLTIGEVVEKLAAVLDSRFPKGTKRAS